MNPTNPTDVLMWLATGVFLLLCGMRLFSDTIREIMSGRLQQMILRLPKYPLVLFCISPVGSTLIQSVIAQPSPLTELSSEGLLPLDITIMVMLGTNIGSALVVQLLVFHITNHALELLGLGAAVTVFTHRAPAFRHSGRMLFAFALIVLGLAAIGIAGQAIAGNDATKSVLNLLEDNNARLVLILIGAFLAIVLNSSIATVGLVVTLAQTGALQPTSALLLMLGANVGTTLRSMLASLNQGTVDGRRLAIVHTGTKLLGTVILLLLIDPLALLLQQILPNDAGTQVGLAHVGFNVALAFLFLPLSYPLARLTERILPEKSSQIPPSSSTHLLERHTTPEKGQKLPTKVIFCYAHEDETLLNELKVHLKPLERQGLIELWYDRMISAGTVWEHEINQHLNIAQIILLLISPDFLNSEYCYGIELKRALERHERREARIIPVILRPVYWQGLLGHLQALPKDALPVTDSQWQDRDKAFCNVTESLRNIIANSDRST